MNYFTDLISTTFYCDIKSNKNIMEIAEFIIQVRGYKKLRSENNKSTFLTSPLQHLFPWFFHPNFLVSKSTFTINYKNETHQISFKVFHPIPIILFIGFCGLQFYFQNFTLISIAFFFILSYFVYNNLNQRIIMKEIIKEINL